MFPGMLHRGVLGGGLLLALSRLSLRASGDAGRPSLRIAASRGPRPLLPELPAPLRAALRSAPPRRLPPADRPLIHG